MNRKLIAGVAAASLVSLALTSAGSASAAGAPPPGFVTWTAGAPASPGHPAVAAMSPTDTTKVPDYYGKPNWVNSPQALADAAVSLVRGNGDSTGAGAVAVANVDPKTGAISAIDVTDPGSGYTVPPTVQITAAGITPSTVATATATLSNGVLTSVSVVEPGFDYTQPQAVAQGGNPTVPAVLQASGSVDVVKITDGGTGYATQPTVEFSLPDLASGSQATGVATMNPAGVITSVEVIDPGSGYTSAPTVVIKDAGVVNPTAATVVATLKVTQIDVIADSGLPPVTGGTGFTSTPSIVITDAAQGGVGTGATAEATLAAQGAVTGIVMGAHGAGYITPGIKKFQDTLPGTTSTSKNNLGAYIPTAVPDTTTYPGTDYYEIGVIQYRHRFSSTLPSAGTLLRGYVQLSTAVVPGLHVALSNANLNPNGASTATGYFGVDEPSYLGPTVVATKDRPVRILFRNLLPTGTGGDLFLPVDTTLMGSGPGDKAMMLDANNVPMDMTADQGTVTDGIRNPYCSQSPKPVTCYTENRSTIHLHGGVTPWISDGTPHQWITPAGESTDYPKGVSVRNVPDMPDPGPGAMTFFYTNQQSARLMFFHDHSWGLTRLNVYAGEAAAYLITDATEQKLIGAGGALEGMGAGQELVVQDKTFVPDTATVQKNDPTWNFAKWGSEGSLWQPHVYMPAQMPQSPTGLSSYGRWMYGPWFWPPNVSKYPPITNPYYDPNCNPDTADFCEPSVIPSTPNVSVGMEAFQDTPIVNGVAYPTTTVDPKAYRYRILNGSDDRFWNLQWYVADPTTGTLSEVALTPQSLADAQQDPNVVPQVDTNKSPAGPSWIQIGNEGGFLPTPTVIANQQTTWITDPTRFDVGNVDKHSLLVAPAERADVVVDFSQYRGKTLILYNDAPAAFPARQANMDYYTGGPDMTGSGGAPTTLPGYGPNTRTLMQVKVSTATPAAAFDRPGTTSDRLGTLMAAFAHHLDANGKPAGVFESGSDPIVVGQAAYNTAYGKSFGAVGYCNTKELAVQPAKCDGMARIAQQGGDPFTFDTLSGNRLAIPLQPKALHDEMNSATEDEYGRMTANLGLEAQGATPLQQNIVLYPYSNPATELLDGTDEPSSLNVTPISTSSDGTQIWKITHNGVDTHPLHFHLFNVQVLNRVTWDNILIPPDPNELGWKETVRTSPLEDTIIALRPILPTMPFGLPDSVRALNPAMPVGAVGDLNGTFNGQEAGFNNTDPAGNPMTTPIANDIINFGWEYVWHCHMLSHEEMDMMRPMSVTAPRALPTAPIVTLTKGAGTVVNIAWTDSTPVSMLDPATWTVNKAQAEIGYTIQRAPITAAGGVGTWADLSTALANQTSTSDSTAGAVKWFYRVIVYNAAGQSISNAKTSADLPTAPTGVTGASGNARIALSWTTPSSNGGAPITGYAIQRSLDSGTTWTTISANTASNATTGIATGLTNGTSYVFRVAAINAAGTGPWSVQSAAAVPDVLPAAPTGVTGTAGAAQVTLYWTAPAANGGSAITAYTIQQSTNNGTSWTTAVASTGSTAVTKVVTALTNGTAYLFRVAAINAGGTGAYSTASAALTPKAATTAPSAPAAPTGTAGAVGSKSITVTWVAPANGGSAITGYLLQWTSNGGTTYTTVAGTNPGTAVTKTVTGLTAATAYRFHVAAINAIGTSAYSVLSTAVTAR
jgi:FtsP/CotA-like multicopper oxidase with cupredoxin domain